MNIPSNVTITGIDEHQQPDELLAWLLETYATPLSPASPSGVMVDATGESTIVVAETHAHDTVTMPHDNQDDASLWFASSDVQHADNDNQDVSVDRDTDENDTTSYHFTLNDKDKALLRKYLLPETSTPHADITQESHSAPLYPTNASVLATDVPALSSSGHLQQVHPSPEMARLRELLLMQQQQHIATLEHEIATMRQKLDDQDALVALVAPVITHAIAYHVRESRDEFAEALYPVIGSTITRAVSQAIRDLARRIDQNMRQGLQSPVKIFQRWRMHMQGVDPNDAALRDMLPFTVQEIFLIHRDTGLLIHHVSSVGRVSDADIISGMLTAIRSYVRDSFGTEREGNLDEISYGNLRILLEDGTSAYLAVVLQGTEPTGYQNHMREQLSQLHVYYGQELRSFTGDSLDEEHVQAFLDPLLEDSHAT